MDEARVERLDAAPLAPELAAIRAQKTKADVAALMGRPGLQPSIFGLTIDADDKAPDRYAVTIKVAGLGLPDRDYYLTDQLADRKAKYQAYVALMLGMIGWDAPEPAAKAIVDFETKIAEASWSRADQRDPVKMYHPMSIPELVAFAPGFDFGAFLNPQGIGGVDRVIVSTDMAFPVVAAIIDATPLDTLKAWQAFHLASKAAPYLSKRFVDANFDFYSRTLSGQPEIRPRWKRAVAFVNGAVGEAVGRMYVAKYFPPESKTKVDALVKEMIAAMHGRIDRLDWMSAATKSRAQEKLAKMKVKIGFPVKWRDYGALTMAADDLYGNVGRTTVYDWNFKLARLNQAGRQGRMGDDAADGQRLLQSVKQRDRAAGRRAAAAVLRSRRRSRGQLWRYRRNDHRSRDELTPSTMRAAGTTATACCGIGGRPRTPPNSRRPPTALQPSSTGSSRSPAISSTAS